MATLKQLEKKVTGLTTKRDKLMHDLAGVKASLAATREEANAAKKAAKEAAPKAVKAARPKKAVKAE